MDPRKGYRYVLAKNGSWNTIRVDNSEYKDQIGATANEAAEYVASLIDYYVESFGMPTDEPFYYTENMALMNYKNRMQLYEEYVKRIDWDQTPLNER